jgi:rhamnose utilization protein RhaD (predicted bifunctional aldolase and dehydrogenase)
MSSAADDYYEEDEDPAYMPELNREQFEIFANANLEEAKMLSLEAKSAVVMEGIFKLCVQLSEEYEEILMDSNEEDIAQIASTQSGRNLMRLASIFGDSIIMILESIAHVKENHKEYSIHVADYQKAVKERMKQQEEELIQTLVDSIPDTVGDDLND